MKKTTLVYLPLLLLLAFAATVLANHYWLIIENSRYAAVQVRMPYTLDGTLTFVQPEAERAGMRVGDSIQAINGNPVGDARLYLQELAKLRPNEPAALTLQRKTENGEPQVFNITLVPQAIERNFNYYGIIAVGFLFNYFLPTICILLGFWVVFVRPRDLLAWLLLFLLLGLSAISFESYPANSIFGLYRSLLFSTWGAAMMLFGLYFPERWEFDRRFPWAKWILLVPLAVQVVFNILYQLKIFAGFNLIDSIAPAARLFGRFVVPLNMIAISVFFLALGWKSGTLTNSDARRRLRLIVYGTTIAMLPSFLIILYRLISGGTGSFFNLVPSWIAFSALLLMPLFPLTLAYVIVVHRAMDVSVVVRQGLQYALAKNGVIVLQFALLVAMFVGVFHLNRNFSENVSVQIGFVVAAFALIPLIGSAAKRLRVWIDRQFFREAYNSEQILSDLSEQVRTMVETKPLLETVSNKISESMHVPQVALLLNNGGQFQPAYALGFDDAPPVSFSDGAVTVEKLKRNEPLIIYTDDQESWVNMENLNGERESLERLNSQLLLPVGVKEKLSGFLSLSPKKSEEPYSPTDLRLLKSVAAQTGVALENSRLTEAIAAEAAQRERLNREVEIAREVQERLFPQDLPKIAGLDYFGGCRPALGVGGDYYDFFALENGKLGIAIGDVSGKGIGASLMMASLQASLRGQAIHFDEDLAALMSNVNRLVYETSTSNRYATFFYSQYDPATRKLTYVNAGHNPPFLFRKTNENYELLRLEEGGAVVGMLPPMLVNYSQGEIEMQSGDLLIGFTDGISEAMNPQDEEWGEERMIAAVEAKIDLLSKEMFAYLVEQADRFADGAKQHDDMTAIIVRVI